MRRNTCCRGGDLPSVMRASPARLVGGCGIRPYRECRESKHPRRGRCPHRPWCVSKNASYCEEQSHVGISHVALLFRRCVPPIESVGMYNGTTLYGNQRGTLRLPRAASRPRNDMVIFTPRKRAGQNASGRDFCLCLCASAAGLVRLAMTSKR